MSIEDGLMVGYVIFGHRLGVMEKERERKKRERKCSKEKERKQKRDNNHTEIIMRRY